MKTQTFKTTVKRVLFRKDDSDWSILLTSPHGICKGNISWKPKENENIELSGNFEVYNGEKQFAFFKANAVIPEDPKSKLYYACQLTKGLGEKIADKIWEEKGNNWENVTVEEISGLTLERLELFHETIEQMQLHAEETKAITFLISKGCSINLAKKAFEKWEISTVPKITENCYVLAELSHIGFKQIDNSIRFAFGIEDNAKERITAGIMYALKEAFRDGSSYVIVEKLQADALILLQVSKNLIFNTIKEMLRDNKLYAYPEHRAITTIEYAEYEECIWGYINGKKNIKNIDCPF